MSKDSKKPAIRFKGFTDDWEQRKLKEITSRVQGNDGRVNLQTLTISAGNGWMKQEDRFSANIAGKEQKNYTLLKKGELAYNHGNSKLAKFGAVFELKDFDEALVPRVYHSFRVNNKTNSSFIEYMFATKLPDKELGKLVSSGARMDGLLNIDYEDFVGINITVPSLEEQQKIAYHFRKLDEVITLHQRKLDKLKNIKKALLEKMFPRNGENIPEVRFKGFSDDWEQRKFKEIAIVRRGLTYSPKDVSSQGVRVLRSSNIEGEFFLLHNDDVFVNSEVVKIEYVKRGDILITAANGSPKLVGKHAIIDSTSSDLPMVHGGFMLVASSNFSDFLNASMGSFWYSSFLKRNVTGGNGAIGNLSKADLDEVTILLPSDNEKIKIGAFFKNLDNLITLHQRKLDKLKNIKKALLEKMFV